jgi:hypothetical protein
MPNDCALTWKRHIRVSIAKEYQGWFLEIGRKKLGPYLGAAVVMRVMAIEASGARRRGLGIEFFVRDNYGLAHPCELLSNNRPTAKCPGCENSWAMRPGPTPPRCPLWEALR